MNLKTLRAVTILVTTTVGAGIYAVPYAFTKIGFPIGLIYLLTLGSVMLFLNLLYGEIVLRTNRHHQLTGYGEIYLGTTGRLLAAISLFVGFYGALLAYLVKIGEFAALLTNYNNPSLFSILFFILGSLIVYRGLRTVTVINVALLFFLVLVIVIIALVSLPILQLSNYSEVNLQFSNLLFPYGIILFALLGSSAVPEMSKVLAEEPDKLKRAIVLGSLIPVTLCLIFTLIIVGVSGKLTSNDAISGLKNFLPLWVIGLGALMGMITMSSAFLSLNYVLKEMWQYDFSFSRPTSLFLALTPSLLLFILGNRNFIQILEVAGSITGGLMGILIIWMFLKSKKGKGLKPAYSLNPPRFILLILVVLFAIGMFFPFLAD